jgi:hypothetical protein
MGSPLFKNDLLTDHEPGIPGGGTPAATEARFTGRNVFQDLDTYWDHEPGRGSPQRHGGSKLKAVSLISLCLRVSVVETGFMGTKKPTADAVGFW